jgi:hypothetical protein
VTQQTNVFDYADTRTDRPTLFDIEGPAAVTARCEQCGEYLERSLSSYLARGSVGVSEPGRCTKRSCGCSGTLSSTSVSRRPLTPNPFSRSSPRKRCSV